MGRPVNSFGYKRKGRLSLAEKSAIQGVAEGPLSIEKAAEKLAPALGRSEEALTKAIREARETFQSRAGQYEELLYESAKVASRKGNHKPALDALDRLVGPKGDRVVQPVQTEQASSGIKVILANVRMGGTREKETDIEVIDAEG